MLMWDSHLPVCWTCGFACLPDFSPFKLNSVLNCWGFPDLLLPLEWQPKWWNNRNTATQFDKNGTITSAFVESLLGVVGVWVNPESEFFVPTKKKVRPKNRLCHSPEFSRNETTKNSDPKHGSGRVLRGSFTKEGRFHLLSVKFNSWAPKSKKQRALKNEWQTKTNRLSL